MWLCLGVSDSDDIEIAHAVTLDRQCLDIPFNLTGLEVAIDTIPNTDIVITQQLVPHLLKRERLILSPFLETRRTGSLVPALARTEKEFVGPINPFGNVLDGLAAQMIPLGVFL